MESDVSIGTNNLQSGDLHTRDLTQFALIQISFCDKSNVYHDNATGSVKSEHGRMSGIVGEEDVSFVMNCDVTTKPLFMLSELAFKSVKHYYKKETRLCLQSLDCHDGPVVHAAAKVVVVVLPLHHDDLGPAGRPAGGRPEGVEGGVHREAVIGVRSCLAADIEAGARDRGGHCGVARACCKC